MWVIFALLDPDPDSEYGSGTGSTDPIEYGSNTDPDPDPQPWKIGPNFFSSAFQKYNNFQFCEIVATKKGMTTNFLSPLSFVAVFRSGVGKNQDADPG